MKANWDLYLLDPLLILIGLFLVFFLFNSNKKTGNKLKWNLIYLEIILIWIANGYISTLLALNLNFISNTYSSSVFIILIIFCSSILFSIILKPVAAIVTAKIRSRKFWIYLSIASTVITLFLGIFFSGTNLVILFIVLGSILIATSLASQSIYYLYFNEQFYYKMFSITSSVIVSILIALGHFIGFWLISLNIASQGFNHFNKDTKIITSSIICILFALLSLSITILRKEDRFQVTRYTEQITKEFKPYSNRILILLILSTFILSIIYALTQIELMDIHIALWMKNKQIDESVIYQTIRLRKELYLVPQFLFGYIFYKFLYKKIGLKKVIISLLIASLVAIALIALIHNPYLIVVMNLILGFAFAQIFCILFATSIMWNYRAKKAPVTGIISATILIGTFLTQSIIVIFNKSEIGIFKNISNIEDILILNNIDIDNLLIQSSNAISIIFAIIFIFTIGYLIWILFILNEIIAEYINYDEMITKIKSLEKVYVITKMKKRLDI